MKFLYFFLLYFFFWGKAHSQDKTQFRIWTDYNVSFKLNKKWATGGDLGYRIVPSNGIQVAYVRPKIFFQANRLLTFDVGVSNFNRWRLQALNRVELRSHQFILLKWPLIKGVQFNHRIGIEQRLFFIKNADINRHIHRFRYFLALKSPEFYLFSIKSPFFVMGKFEILANFYDSNKESILDHTRLTVGIGNQINEKFRIDLRYAIHSFVNPTFNDLAREVDVLRLRLYYQFK